MSEAAPPDLADLVSRFGERLHAAGIPVTPTASGRFADAIALARPEKTAQLRSLGRATMTHDHSHLEVFDRVFDDVFGGFADDAVRNPNQAVMPTPSTRPSEGTPPERDRSGQTAPGAPRPGLPGPPADGAVRDGDGDEALLAAMSDEERLRERSFGDCTPDELERLGRLIGELRVAPPLRSHRRTTRSRRGHGVDLRATVRGSLRTGGDPLRIVRRRRRRRMRRVVLFSDVSGSMESYGRAYLYLLHGAVRAIDAEAFVFATRLHRLTRPLAVRRPADALQRAMAAAPTWSGGTRIGSALATFNDDHGRRGIARGAVVVIVSDGWEVGDTDLLAREMERLARLAHRIVWVNPRSARPGYRPLAAGMAAALPYVDVFVSGHSLAVIEDVIDAIADDSPRRANSRPAGRDRPATVAASSVGSETPDGPDGPIHATSMDPEFGTVTKLSPTRRWDPFGRPAPSHHSTSDR